MLDAQDKTQGGCHVLEAYCHCYTASCVSSQRDAQAAPVGRLQATSDPPVTPSQALSILDVTFDIKAELHDCEIDVGLIAIVANSS